MFKDFLKNNEENVISIVTIIIILIALIIIILNWIFTMSGSKKENELNKYELVNYEEVMKEEYSDEIVNLLKTKNIDLLYKKTSIEFLSDNSLTEDNFKGFLLSNNLIGNSITIVSSSCMESDGTYIFRFYYKNYNDYKYINVIELKPDEYYISFDQDFTTINTSLKSYVGSNNDVNAELSVIEMGEEYIRYNIRITNNNALDIKVNFNDINTFSLIGDDITITLAGVVAENVSAITTGGSINRELYFSINSEELNNCYGLLIKDVELNNDFFDIIIYF